MHRILNFPSSPSRPVLDLVQPLSVDSTMFLSPLLHLIHVHQSAYTHRIFPHRLGHCIAH